MTKKVVSVQDISCYGQCSQTVALPVLSVLGVETVILPSAVLSTHTTSFEGYTVHDLTEEMPKIVAHWKKENIKFDAIYTGYISDVRQFDCILDLRSQLNPGGMVIVDPAMADHGELYPALSDDIVEGMRRLVSVADVIIPNITEAVLLTNTEYKPDFTQDEIEGILHKLAALGPRYSVITGVSYESGKLGAVCFDKESGEITNYFSDYVNKICYGTGDIFSSVVVGRMVNGSSVYDALKTASEFVASCIRATIDDDEHHYGVHFESVLHELLK